MFDVPAERAALRLLGGSAFQLGNEVRGLENTLGGHSVFGVVCSIANGWSLTLRFFCFVRNESKLHDLIERDVMSRIEHWQRHRARVVIETHVIVVWTSKRIKAVGGSAGHAPD